MKKTQPIKVENQTGRNEKVVITDGNETKEVKEKSKTSSRKWKVEEDIRSDQQNIKYIIS